MALELYTLHTQIQDEDGTFSALLDPTGKQIAVTCELPWNNNAVGESCIPEGEYDVIPHNSAKFPNCWEVLVPDRTGILLHAGNTIEDTDGCILPGKVFGMVNDMEGVLHSREAMDYLRAVLPPKFRLRVERPPANDRAN